MKKINSKVSIIVPCYNMEKHIEKCMDSIKNQTYKNIEVLLIDDGSRDNTSRIINDKIKEEKLKFKYFYKENGGLSDARNFGLKKATGKYVCFIDSDDYIEHDYIEKLYESITQNNSKISVCGFKRVYKKKTTTEDMKEDLVKLCIRPAAWNKMFELSLFTDNNIYFPLKKWYEDLGTISKLLFISDCDFSITNDKLYNYVQHSNSIMHTYDDRIFDIYEILDDVIVFCKENEIYEKYKSNIEFMYIYHVLIGTIYRSSFHKRFSVNLIEEIVENVESKYPDWYDNSYLKNLSKVYQLYLYLVHKRRFKLLHFLLKYFSKYLYL